MSKNDIMKKVESLKEIESFIEELNAEAETIRDSIKAEMLERGVEELDAGAYMIHWTPILSNRFDSCIWTWTGLYHLYDGKRK